MAGPVSVPVAIVIGLISSFIQSLGLTIQRKSHIQNAQVSVDRQRSEWQRPLWVIGFFVFLIANIGGTIFQIGALPIVMLAPLGAVSLLYNSLLARFLLDDFCSSYMLIGTVLIAIGAGLIGYFGVVEEPTHSLDDLLALYARPTFVVFATLFALTFIGCLAIAHLAEWQMHVKLFRPNHPQSTSKRRSITGLGHRKGRRPLPRRWSAPSLAPVAEVSESSSGIATPVLAIADEASRRGIPVERVLMQKGGPSALPISRTVSTPLNNKANGVPDYGSTARTRGSSLSSSAQASAEGNERPQRRSTSAAAAAAAVNDAGIRRTCLGLAIAYGAASGTLSGACLLLAKSGVELLVLTFSGDNQFNRWQSWLLVTVMIFAALLQLWYLNKALRLASPPLVCPLAFCFYNTSSIALGLIYFDQLGALTLNSLLLVVLGTFVLLTGVWMVSLHGAEAGEESKREEEDVERQPLMADIGDLTSSPTAVASSSPLAPEGSSVPIAADVGTLLANAAGIAGPHLPPVTSATEETASDSEPVSPTTLRQAERGEAESGPSSPVRRRRSRSGSGTMGGLGLHMPGLAQYSPEHEHRDEEGHARGASPSGDETAMERAESLPAHTTPKRKRFLPGLGPAAQLFSPPSQKRRGLYEFVLERGLSIGISPSSPGFHVGSTFEMEREAAEEEPQDAPHARRRRLTSRRTFSENDTSLASARRDARRAQGLDPEGRGIAETDTPSSGSAWSRVMPALDIQVLNERLRRIKLDAGGWIKDLRGN